MGKRAASPSKAATKAVKQAKVVAEPVPVDPFLEACAPVRDFLDGAEVSEECREMLRLATPHALKTFKADRHKYQICIVEQLGGLILTAGGKCQEQVVAAEQDCAKAAGEQTSAGEELGAAQVAVDARLKTCDEAEATYKGRQVTVKAAKDALATAKKDLVDLAAKEAARGEEKQEYEKAMTELWEPLKAATFGKGNVKERNGKLVDLLKLMGRCGTAPSLTQGLSVSLKQNPDKRGTFALKTLQYGEAALTGHVEKLAAEALGHDAVVVEKQKETAAAEAAVQEAEAAQEAAWNESAEVQNLWTEDTDKVNKLKKIIEDAVPRAKELAAVLAAAQAAAEANKKLAARFEALQERAAAPAPAVEE